MIQNTQQINGRLYRVDLADPKMVEIDTGFAKACNNDHGLSPDGGLLAISDGTELGESCIYTQPVGGGTPNKEQGRPPCYWHGWSPNGATLAYVAKRGATFQVFTCPVSGGVEAQITHGFDHCDGPDYSPDRQWLWFNGEKGGSVQLWRIRPGRRRARADDERRGRQLVPATLAGRPACSVPGLRARHQGPSARPAR